MYRAMPPTPSSSTIRRPPEGHSVPENITTSATYHTQCMSRLSSSSRTSSLHPIAQTRFAQIALFAEREWAPWAARILALQASGVYLVLFHSDFQKPYFRRRSNMAPPLRSPAPLAPATDHARPGQRWRAGASRARRSAGAWRNFPRETLLFSPHIFDNRIESLTCFRRVGPF
jgi:hypothetical protein